MKKIISTIALLACMFSFSRCSEDAYTEKYTDPNKITGLLMEKVMTGVIKINIYYPGASETFSFV
jgi:hypothetical protein